MTPARIPEDEDRRLAALRSLLILDTPPELRFDRIVQFASAEFDVPIAAFSLVDSNRQWFKSRVGLSACETSRDVSFCAHAVHDRTMLVIEDARRDERFSDNPLVTGSPHICAYVGAPLQLPGGAVIGTLCLMDTRPRRFDATDLAIVETLRDLLCAEIAAGNRPTPDDAVPA